MHRQRHGALAVLERLPFLAQGAFAVEERVLLAGEGVAALVEFRPRRRVRAEELVGCALCCGERGLGVHRGLEDGGAFLEERAGTCCRVTLPGAAVDAVLELRERVPALVAESGLGVAEFDLDRRVSCGRCGDLGPRGGALTGVPGDLVVEQRPLP